LTAREVEQQVWRTRNFVWDCFIAWLIARVDHAPVGDAGEVWEDEGPVPVVRGYQRALVRAFKRCPKEVAKRWRARLEPTPFRGMVPR